MEPRRSNTSLDLQAATMKTAAPTRYRWRSFFHLGKVRIGARLTICFLIIAFSMVAADAVVFWQFTEMAGAASTLSNADHSSLAVVRLHLDVATFRQHLADLESGHDANRFSTEAASVRETLLRDVQGAEQALAMTPEITRQDPSVGPALQTLRVALPSQLDIAVQLSNAGDWTALSIRVKQQIQDLVELCSSLAARVDRQAQQQRATAIRHAETLRQRLFVVVPVAGLLTLLVALILGWYVTRSITTPLAKLTSGADALARGDFHHQVDIDGNDELTVLGKAFNHAARQLDNQFELTLEARVAERTRIARELHDTLLQSFHGVLLYFQSGINLLPDHSPESRIAEARKALHKAMQQAEHAIVEGRDAIQGLRSSVIETNDLGLFMRTLGEALAVNSKSLAFQVNVEGEPRNLHSILRDEVYRIAGEAIRNAFRHADAQRIEVEIHYDEQELRVRVRDNGKGIDPKLVDDGRKGHFGLRGMRERANLVGGKVTMWSELDAGTEVELCIPAARAYTRISDGAISS
jgi:signal transduction histidine kinase